MSEKFKKPKENRLFLLFEKSPSRGKAASSQTISKWIVRVIQEAYIKEGREAPWVRAHSTRGTSASWALFNQATPHAVMKAADWRNHDTFCKHYAKDMYKHKDDAFGKAVLKTATLGTV